MTTRGKMYCKIGLLYIACQCLWYFSYLSCVHLQYSIYACTSQVFDFYGVLLVYCDECDRLVKYFVISYTEHLI